MFVQQIYRSDKRWLMNEISDKRGKFECDMITLSKKNQTINERL